MSVLRAVCFLTGLAAVAHALALLPGPAVAGTGATVDVDHFGVERVESLLPGVPLHFSLYGTSGARVLVFVSGGGDALPLRETRPGMYEGEYVISANDRIDAHSRVSATVERDGVAARVPLAEPLLLERGSVPWATILGQSSDAPAPAAPQRAEPMALSLPPTSLPNASLPPVVATPPPAVVEMTTRSAAACTDCATVLSIVPLPPMPHDVLGGLAGAAAGAAAANAGSEGHAKKVLRVVGAITGYIVGGELARRLTRPAGYDVVFRLPDGSTLRRRYDAAPVFRVGDTVSPSLISTLTRPGSF